MYQTGSGKRTLKQFLEKALEPVGTVLYIFGGGWNPEDTAAACETRRIGLQESWLRFFWQQTACYSYRNDADKAHSYYPYDGKNRYSACGLDCSGYVGYAMYNLLETENGKAGYVYLASEQAWIFASRLGLGSFTKEVKDSSAFLPGDIFSMEGHVWICLGRCEDGSLVILHSTPSPSICGCPGGGVQLSGLGNGPDCEAYALAKRYMKQFYPEWSSRYEAVVKPYGQYTASAGIHTGKFSWRIGDGGLADPEGYKEKMACGILKDLFGA